MEKFDPDIINLPDEQVTLPENWHFTGEYRKPEFGETYVNHHLRIDICRDYIDGSRYIVKKIRWKARLSETYYYIDEKLNSRVDYDTGSIFDNGRYMAGNYFKTQAQAELAASKIKELLEGLS